MKLYSYELWQDGICVAGVDGPDAQSAVGEIMHYAMVYAQDGPVTVKGTNKHSRDALAGKRIER